MDKIKGSILELLNSVATKIARAHRLHGLKSRLSDLNRQSDRMINKPAGLYSVNEHFDILAEQIHIRREIRKIQPRI